jgi:S-adenosylmethionine hydrolase
VRTSDDRVYVGPDNGLLSLAAAHDEVQAVRSLTNPRYQLEQVSRTFHARDIFAPVAAHLASGVSFEELGEEVDPATLVRLRLPEPTVGSNRIVATVLAVDRFGNLQLNMTADHIAAANLEPGDRVELIFSTSAYFATVAVTFEARRGDLILYEDSYGALSIAISGGNAAKLTAAAAGEEVTILPQ